MRRLLFVLLLAMAAPTYAGDRLPSWLRIVDWDGQVLDVGAIGIKSITVCPITGSANLWSQEEGSGMARVSTAWGEVTLRYDYKFYNQGSITNNPNTTGDQVVLIETVQGIFGGGFDDCVTYGE